MLRRVAATIRSQIREQDIVARWGGEEFILLFPDTDASGAAVVAEKIRACMEATFDGGGERLRVTMTIGLAQASKETTREACTAQADDALYRGKAQRKEPCHRRERDRRRRASETKLLRRGDNQPLRRSAVRT